MQSQYTRGRPLTASAPPLLTRLRQTRRRVHVLVTGLAYLITAAILPAGHMAAPLASGTLFHLCPGDARSAQLLAVLSHEPQAGSIKDTRGHWVLDAHAHAHESFAADHPAASAVASTEGGASGPKLDHGHSHGHEAVPGDERVVDASCTLAGFADPELPALATPPGVAEAPVAAPPRLPLSRYRSERWLRPSARSPPRLA